MPDSTKMVVYITTIIGVSLASTNDLIDAEALNRLFKFIQYITCGHEPFYQQLSIRKDRHVTL
jgi:hypothetical protein